MSFIVESVVHWVSYDFKQENPLQNYKNHSQLPTIFILLSFFPSLSHYFKVHKIEIRFFWDVLIKRLCYLGKVSTIEAATAWNRWIPCKFLKITHKYLIFLHCYHFLLHWHIILSFTDLRFDYIEMFWVRGEVIWRKCHPFR